MRNRGGGRRELRNGGVGRRELRNGGVGGRELGWRRKRQGWVGEEGLIRNGWKKLGWGRVEVLG